MYATRTISPVRLPNDPFVDARVGLGAMERVRGVDRVGSAGVGHGAVLLVAVDGSFGRLIGRWRSVAVVGNSSDICRPHLWLFARHGHLKRGNRRGAQWGPVGRADPRGRYERVSAIGMDP